MICFSLETNSTANSLLNLGLLKWQPHQPFWITWQLYFFFKCYLFKRHRQSTHRSAHVPPSTGSLPKSPHLLGLGQAQIRSQKAIQVSHLGGKNPAIWAITLQGLHWEESRVRSKSWNLNPATPMWDTGISTTRLNVHSLIRCFRPSILSHIYYIS